MSKVQMPFCPGQCVQLCQGLLMRHTRAPVLRLLPRAGRRVRRGCGRPESAVWNRVQNQRKFSPGRTSSTSPFWKISSFRILALTTRGLSEGPSDRSHLPWERLGEGLQGPFSSGVQDFYSEMELKSSRGAENSMP